MYVLAAWSEDPVNWVAIATPLLLGALLIAGLIRGRHSDLQHRRDLEFVDRLGANLEVIGAHRMREVRTVVALARDTYPELLDQPETHFPRLANLAERRAHEAAWRRIRDARQSEVSYSRDFAEVAHWMDLMILLDDIQTFLPVALREEAVAAG